MDPTQRLTDYVISSRAQDLPDDVIHEAKRSFLNWLGVAIGACQHPTVKIALEVVDEVGGSEQATVLGHRKKTDILHAAFINGTSSHVFDFDDTHLQTIIHPSGPVAPALLALAERQILSGESFLHAFTLGIEVECRIGNAVYPSHYDVGWHITATTGVFGAAAAAAKVLQLDNERTLWALGIAATQSSGLREMFGTMCKAFHVGRAAQNGLFAALLASRGFTSSTQSIEAPRGFANVLASERNYHKITDNLGGSYEVLKNTYKPFACGIVIHPTIDGCIQLRNKHGLKPEEIRSIDLRVHPLVLELTGKTEPKRGLEGKFSVYHSAAVAITDGAAAESQYSDERVLDPQVVELRRKVTTTAEAGIDEAEAHIRITMTDGTVHEIHIEKAVGSLEKPLSDADLENKFRELVSPILPSPTKVDELIRLCWELDKLEDASAIAKAAVPA